MTDDVLDSEAPDDAFLATLEAVATYVRKTGLSHASAPTGGLEMEVDRLATAKTGSCIIVQRLVDLMHDFTRRRGAGVPATDVERHVRAHHIATGAARSHAL